MATAYRKLIDQRLVIGQPKDPSEDRPKMLMLPVDRTTTEVMNKRQRLADSLSWSDLLTMAPVLPEPVLEPGDVWVSKQGHRLGLRLVYGLFSPMPSGWPDQLPNGTMTVFGSPIDLVFETPEARFYGSVRPHDVYKLAQSQIDQTVLDCLWSAYDTVRWMLLEGSWDQHWACLPEIACRLLTQAQSQP